MQEEFTCGSFFTGGGGFEVAAQSLGWKHEFFCEINHFCIKLLQHHFPNTQIYRSIQNADFSIWRNKLDIITGGFPCQPFSHSGDMLGTADDRYLWDEMLRGIREARPTWVVGENVYGIVTWNNGEVFERVQADLELEGYKVQTYLLQSRTVGAQHRRQRCFFVAYSESNRLERRENKRRSQRRATALPENYSWSESESDVIRRFNGVSPELDSISLSVWKKEAIRAMGNAIVPAQVMPILYAIEEYESLY